MAAKPYTLAELEAVLAGQATLNHARLAATPQPIQLQAVKASEGTNAGFGGGTTAGSTYPGVSSTLANDVINFALPNQLKDVTIPKGITTTSSGDVTQMTYEQAVEFIHQIQGTPLLTTLQQELHNSGYLTGDKIAYGTLDAKTITAWKQLLTDSVTANNATQSLTGKPMTVMGLLATNQGSNFISTLQALETKSQAAQNAAATVSAPILNLQDPNQVAQAFASAYEALGLGAPPKEAVAKFVDAFHSAEVGAEQNAYTAQKSDYLAGAAQDQSQLTQLVDGQHGNPTPAQSMGPVDVATKAMPNLDAEAMAAAKNANPGQYYATQASYYGEMIHNLLAGNLGGQTSPTAPSQTAPGGAIVSAPMGAM